MVQDTLPESKMPAVPSRILLGPGPSNASPRVLQAMMAPMIGYLDPDFMLILDEISELLKRVFQTQECLTMAISGTGSAGMEAGLSSFLEPGDTVIVCAYGHFCERMILMCERLDVEVVPVRSEWGKAMDPALLEEALRRHSTVKLVTAIHAETSTGVLQPLQELSRLAHQHGALGEREQMGGLMQCATRVVCVGLMQLMDGIEVPGGVEVGFANLQVDDLPALGLQSPGLGQHFKRGFGAQIHHTGGYCHISSCLGRRVNARIIG